MGKILDFLLGKSPKIFDRDGSVRHDLGQKKWSDWNDRYQKGSEYNWKNHTGTKAGAASSGSKNS